MRRGQEDVTVTGILDERILQPAVGDVKLSSVLTEDDPGQSPVRTPRGS